MSVEDNLLQDNGKQSVFVFVAVVVVLKNRNSVNTQICQLSTPAVGHWRELPMSSSLRNKCSLQEEPESQHYILGSAPGSRLQAPGGISTALRTGPFACASALTPGCRAERSTVELALFLSSPLSCLITPGWEAPAFLSLEEIHRHWLTCQGKQ